MSCSRIPEIQQPGAAYLQGEWVQDSIPGQDQMLQYTLTDFIFTCDSIYTKMHVTSKQQQIADSCYNHGKWEEYAKGIYVVRGDSIIVDGIYTKEMGKQKISGCYRIGQYLPRFKIVKYTTDSLILESKFDQRPIVLRKIRDISCVPQPRYN